MTKSLLDKIVDCAHSHFAWDASDCPETKASMDDFRAKVRKILRSSRPKQKP